MELLDPYPDLPRYQSCIKFYGKSILPPLISDAQRKELSDYQHQASVVEERLNKLRKDKISKSLRRIRSAEDLPVLSNAIPENAQGLNFDIISSVVSNSGSLQSLNNICEEDENEEVISICIEEPLSNLNDDTPSENVGIIVKQAFNNICPLLDTTDQIPLSDISCSFNRSSSWISESMKGSSAESGMSHESSDSDDVDYQSINTVVSNVYIDVNCNQDSDSVITSVARSSDLEKYMDCYDEGLFSEQTPDVHDSDIGALITFSSSSAETLIDHSNTSTPFVPLTVPLLDSNPDTPFNGPNMSPVSEDGHQNITNGILTQLLLNSGGNKHESVNINGSNIEIFDVNSVDQVHSGHKRSNSYTIELPSPVLLESHGDCPCLVSPVGVPVPHCSSIGVGCLFFGGTNSEASNNFLTGKKSECNLNSSKMLEKSRDPVPQPIEKQVVLESPSSVDPPKPSTLSKEDVLNDFYKSFKEDHQKKVEQLLQQQNEQWMKLQEEFEEKEKEILNRLQEIANEDTEEKPIADTIPDATVNSDVLAAANDIQEEVHAVVQEPSSSSVQAELQSILAAIERKVLLQFPDVEVSSSSNDPSEEAKSLTRLIVQRKFEDEHSDAVNDPANHEKFIKLTAVAKGFLVRCLLRTSLVQNIKRTMLDSLDMIGAIQERALKRGLSKEDARLHSACRKQMWNALDDIHHIFFTLSAKEKMQILSESRKREEEARTKPPPPVHQPRAQRVASSPSVRSSPSVAKPSPKLSSATVKRLERMKGLSRSRERLCRSVLNSSRGRSPSLKNIAFPRSKSSLASLATSNRK